MVERGEHGRLKKGSVLNPKGRAPRAVEDTFTAVIHSEISPEDFRLVLRKHWKRAEVDLEEFKYCCKLLGLEVDKKQLSGPGGGDLTFIVQELINA
jgi:hypothetical protein